MWHLFMTKREHSGNQKKYDGNAMNGKFTFFFQETQQTITIEYNKHGLYNCYCTHLACSIRKGYTTIEGFKKQMQKIKS